MTPMCENVTGIIFDKVHKAYPEIHNYENAVIENKYFSSCGHMNDVGAEYLRQLLYDFLKLKMKIAFLTEYPHPLTGNSGGIGTSIKNLAGTCGCWL
jgi:hypothetical protein